ncbi:hypothetical protein Hypma_013212 [Hypsizygus marmoreus]|uniref:Uncharacterized protein n=1 Tax=Hypsizygus marmoreus TaxID=39966 RepID=A0A369JC50_HYPMA|nr:hypothetical protein Hypma_013212 [Hypsizygus marmoreus]
MDSSSWDLTPDDALDFVVHHFSLLGSTQAPTILDDAQSVIRAATARDEWINVGFTSSLRLTRQFSDTKCFQYRSLAIHLAGEESRRFYKEWGTPVTEDEIFRLDDLDDFASTDLAYLLDITLPAHPYPAHPANEKANTELILDLNPLHTIIPQPHIHASPYIPTPTPTQPKPKPTKMTPYAKIPPTPIPPHVFPLPPASSSPYARNAWLVPIRGAFPWEGCTAAVVLDPSSSVIPIPVPVNKHAVIAWTHGSLNKFWAFLLGVRDAHTLGPVGVSFHAAAPSQFRSQSQLSSVRYTPGAGGQLHTKSESESEFDQSAAPTTRTVVTRAALANVDYVKVYHEAAYTMYLRNVLHLWGYVVGSEDVGEGRVEEEGEEKEKEEVGKKEKEKKIRLLKGARLVLVDERARGVLVS